MRRIPILTVALAGLLAFGSVGSASADDFSFSIGYGTSNCYPPAYGGGWGGHPTYVYTYPTYVYRPPVYSYPRYHYPVYRAPSYRPWRSSYSYSYPGWDRHDRGRPYWSYRDHDRGNDRGRGDDRGHGRRR